MKDGRKQEAKCMVWAGRNGETRKQKEKEGRGGAHWGIGRRGKNSKTWKANSGTDGGDDKAGDGGARRNATGCRKLNTKQQATSKNVNKQRNKNENGLNNSGGQLANRSNT